MAIWYDTGKIAVDNGARTVTGTGTQWVGAVNPGDAIHTPDERQYQVVSIDSNTQLTLSRDYLGASVSEADYEIQPTRALTQEYVSVGQSLFSQVEQYIDGVLAGKFPAGTIGAPPITAAADPDTGVRFPGGNQIEQITGGVRRALLGTTSWQIDVPITGAAVQANPLDGSAGKVLLRDAFGLGAQQFQTSALRLTDLNATNARAGRYGTDAATVGTFPPSTSQYGVLDYMPYNSSDTTGTTQIEETYYPVGETPVIWTRSFRDNAWSAWERVLTGGQVQASPTDATAGKLMTVGAFGLGSTAPTEISNIDDTTLGAGFYNVHGQNTVGTFPGGAQAYGMLEVIPYSTSRIFQRFAPTNSALSYWRYHGDAGWTPWRRDYNQGTILGAVAHSGGVPTGGIIERGSNANGEYVRFADGTQICTKAAIVNLTTAVGGDFTYPASFVTAPAASWSVQRGDLSVPGAEASALLNSYVIGGSSQWRFRSDGTGGSTGFNVALSAIGRWF